MRLSVLNRIRWCVRFYDVMMLGVQFARFSDVAEISRLWSSRGICTNIYQDDSYNAEMTVYYSHQSRNVYISISAPEDGRSYKDGT